MPRRTYFATCAPGVEPILHEEGKALRLAKLERQVGGIRFEGDRREAWRANLLLRTAVRVLERLERFNTPDGDALYHGVQAVDWRRYLHPEGSLVVTAQTKESLLDHSLFVEQRTKDAIVDQLRTASGSRPTVSKDDPDLAVHVHLYRDRCTVSLDTSGSSLHKRGGRRFQGRAPLSETLAAAVVLFSGWDQCSPLIDPFCGSATLLIEAALLARGVPPGSFRKEFGFERFADHDARAYRRLRDDLERRAQPIGRAGKLILRGIESDPETLAGARSNAEAAGVADAIDLQKGNARNVEFRRGWNGWIVTNPPYGERVGSNDNLHSLYRDFGSRLREQCEGYQLALLSGNPSLEEDLGLAPQRAIELQNGALPCRLLTLEIPRA